MTSFYKSFFILLVPMALKELIAAFINLLDTVMLGPLGTDIIAAVGIANQWYFLFTVVVFGMCGGAGVFASQYWGAGDIKNMRKVLGINLMLVAGLSALFILISVFAPQLIMAVFSEEKAVIGYGVKYLRIVCFSYVLSGITAAYDMSLCCSEKANISFAARFIGLIVNLAANWILIYGKLGAPILGIEGAAIATVIARGTELLVILGAVYGKKLIQAAAFSEMFTFEKGMLKKYFKAALPVTLNESAWALGTITYSWVFSQVSTEALVVITIVQNIERLLLVFFHGGGNAAGILVGKLVGSGDFDNAYKVSKRLCILNTVFSIAVAGVFIVIRPLVLIPYNVEPEILEKTLNILFLTALIMTVKALTFFFIVGVFRNGGDTNFAALIDISSMWIIGVPCVLLAGLVFELPLEWIYVMMMSEEVAKLALSIWRFKSKKWIKNLVKT
ncbi:MAG: MATE family efflux transporter [Ruminococcaceae bacterium]|nr:MATE family efflux transporter [Oscillospiraceae bacterium]